MPVSTKIQVEGDKEYIQAMKDAKSSLKELGSELKVEKAEMDRHGKSVQSVRKNYETLKKQYDVQKQAVGVMNERLEKLKQKYGENSREVSAYQIEVNNATAQLEKFGSQMDAAEKSLGEFDTTLGSVKDKLKGGIEAAAKGAGEALKKVGVTASVAFAAVSAAAVKAIQTVDTLERNAAQWAGDLSGMSATSGVDVETLQKWQYAASQVGVSYEEMLNALKELQKKSAEDSGVDALAYLGISPELGNVEKFFLVLQQIKTLTDSGVMSESEAAKTMDELFGDSQAMLPLINGLEKWNAAMAEAENNNVIVSEKDIEALTSLESVLEKFDLLKNTLTTSIAALFAGDWSQLYEDVNGLFSSLIGMITGDSEIGDVESAMNKLVEDLGTALDNAAETISTFIEKLQGSDNEKVKAIGDALAAIRDAAYTLWQNRDKIVTALGAIVGIFAAGKMASAITNIGKFASGIAGIAKSLADIIANKGASQVLEDVATASAGGAEATGTGTTGTAGTGTSTTPRTPYISTSSSGKLPGVSAGKFSDFGFNLLKSAALAVAMYPIERALADGSIQVALSEDSVQNLFDQASQGAATVFAPEEKTVVQQLIDGGSEQSKGMRNVVGAIFGWNTEEAPPVEVDAEVENADITSKAVSQMQSQLNNAGFSAPVTAYFTNGGSFGAGGTGIRRKAEKSIGMDEVPYDGYEAVLHKGEAVLTKMQATKWRAKGANGNKASAGTDMSEVVSAITQGMQGISVNMDGQKVGTLVASTVSREIVKGLRL